LLLEIELRTPIYLAGDNLKHSVSLTPDLKSYEESQQAVVSMTEDLISWACPYENKEDIPQRSDREAAVQEYKELVKKGIIQNG